jgi:aryl-alcohol dehydrogenase-like predicted oxidoreductase
MHYRTFPRTGWQIAEIGHGMWGMGGWTGSNDEQSLEALDLAVSLGCNFFDTAWAYGNGRSERLLGETLRTHRDTRLYVATKVPPKNLRWPARSDYSLDEVFPPEHVREYTEKSLRNLGVDAIDLQQLHVWSDAWTADERWRRVSEDLKREGKIRAFGISLNRWEPWNGIRAVQTGAVDCVQVVYNVFDQAPEDELFPACEERRVAVIARVPFDEGSLAGTLRPDSHFPREDWRSLYFTPDNLAATLARVDRLRQSLPAGMEIPDLALRFVLEHPTVSTTIPGMRRTAHVERNMAASTGTPLPDDLYRALRGHRWDRNAVIP